MEGVLLVFIVQAVVFGVFCSFIAKEKNRNSAEWFILGFLFSILAVFALIAVPRIERRPAQLFVKAKSVCPYCKEEVQPDAILCKHCRSDLSMNKPILLSSSTEVTEKTTDTRSSLTDNGYKIVCNQCGNFEIIKIEHLTIKEAYSKFSTQFSRTKSRISCNSCGKVFAFNPYTAKRVLNKN